MANDWIDLIRNYIHLEELDRPTLLKLVQKNVVSKKYDEHLPAGRNTVPFLCHQADNGRQLAPGAVPTHGDAGGIDSSSARSTAQR